MGCDIHWYSEHRENGIWKCDQAESFTINEPDYDGGQPYPEMDNFPGRQRDYWFFGLLNSDVRSYWEYSFQGKGDIAECSYEVQAQLEHWCDDGHSHSWLTRKELEDKIKELELLQAEMLIAPRDPNVLTPQVVTHHLQRLGSVIADLKALHPEAAAEDQRIVFWFDN